MGRGVRYLRAKLPSFVHHRIEYVALCLVTVAYTEVLSFSGNLPIGGDILFPFNSTFLDRYFFSWNHWVDLGSNVPYVLAGPPLLDAMVFGFLYRLGLSPVASVWLFFFGFSLLGAAGSCYLLQTIFPHLKYQAAAGFVSGLVFLYNPLYVTDTYKSLFLGLVERSVFPVTVAFYLRGIETKKFQYALPVALSSFLLLGRFPVYSLRFGLAMLAVIAFVSMCKVSLSG